MLDDGLQQVLHPLRSLLLEKDDYDNDFLEPTPYAVQVAENLLLEAERLLEDDMPSTIATTLGDGGVRIHFRHPRRLLRLAIPAEATGFGYIYHSEGDEYGSDNDISITTLFNWLKWLKADG